MSDILWVELPGKETYHLARRENDGAIKTLCCGTCRTANLQGWIVAERSEGRRMCKACYATAFTLAKRGRFVMPLRTAWEREQWNTVETERPGIALRTPKVPCPACAGYADCDGWHD
jgi:hypothetical protein